MIESLRNLNEYPLTQANEVKASKYECLLGCIMSCLEGTPLEELNRKWQHVKSREMTPLARLTAYRDFYGDALPLLRKEIEHCQKGAYRLFTGNDMETQSKELIEMFLKDANMEGLGLIDALAKTKTLIDDAPPDLKTHWANAMIKSGFDWMDYKFSPLNAGNPPQSFPFVSFFGGKLRLLANGSPTIQVGPAVIDPLFIGFLKELVARKERYLYISNQNGLSSENRRNQLILKLQSDPEFQESFVAVTCAKDSDFYWRTKPLANAAFKESLHRQFFGLRYEESGCYVPTKLDLEEKCRQLIEILGELLLGQEPNLQEQHAMIDFFYVLLASLVAFETKADFISFTCKDGIDRGMESLSEFLLLWLVVIGFDLDSQVSIEMFTKTLFTRAYWVRKRSINQVRFDRFISNAALFIQKASDSGKKTQFIDKLFKLIPLEGANAATIC